MTGSVVFVVSNVANDEKSGMTNTGWYLPEAAHPYKVLTAAGYTIKFVSPKGGLAPMDVSSGTAFKDDVICQEFLKDANVMSQLKNTLKPSDVKASDFVGLFYVGGHGPMFDLPACTPIAELARDIYEKGGVLGAVCHGTVGFESIKLSNGEYLIKGQTVASFTNSEENAVGLTEKMPFLLETRLKERGATFKDAADWSCNVAVSGRLVSGQNPQSATECANEMVKVLAKK